MRRATCTVLLAALLGSPSWGCSHDLDSLRATVDAGGSRDGGTVDAGGGDSGGGDAGGEDAGPVEGCESVPTDVELASAPSTGSPTMGLLLGPSPRLNVWRFQLTEPLLVQELGFVGTTESTVTVRLAVVSIADGEAHPGAGATPVVGPIDFDPGVVDTADEITATTAPDCLPPGWYAATVTALEDGTGARIAGGHATDPSGPSRPYVYTSGTTSTQSGDVRIFVRGHE